MLANIVKALYHIQGRFRTEPVYQYDYGQILRLSGFPNLPQAWEIHFSNDQFGVSTTQIGTGEEVIIPDIYLTTGKTVYAWLYLHTGTEDGETRYLIEIPVKPRASISNQEPTPVQQDAITQAIAALDAAVAQTGQDVVDTNAAKEAAQEAQGLAENAQAAAETAQANAETAQRMAEQEAANAHASAEASGRSAATAREYAEEAHQSALDSAQSAADSEHSAERAEQAANTAGYMEFMIDENGHVIYIKTPMVDADFELEDGHLIMEVDG